MNIQNALEFVEENYDVFRTLVNDFELCEESFRSIVEYDMKYDWIDSGASKGVICPHHKEDYVIKIPFNYDDCSEESIETNYCELEYHNYLKAKELGLEEFFAEIEPLINIDGITIYIQEKLTSGFYSSYDDALASNIVSNTYGPVKSECPVRFIPILINNYGAEKTMNFLIFIEENDINDLREANMGSTKKHKIKLLDYSGFVIKE